MNKQQTLIHNKDCTNPSYKVVLIKKDCVHVWLFYSNERDTVYTLYNRFKSCNLAVKLYERLWKQVE